MVQGGIILGGDIACAEVDGFMHGFAKDSAYYGDTGPSENKENTQESMPSESSVAEMELGTSSLVSEQTEETNENIVSQAESSVTSQLE